MYSLISSRCSLFLIAVEVFGKEQRRFRLAHAGGAEVEHAGNRSLREAELAERAPQQAADIVQDFILPNYI